MRLSQIAELDSIERTGLRAYIQRRSLPPLKIIKALVKHGMIYPGPGFGLCEGVKEAMEKFERERKKASVSGVPPEEIIRRLRARGEDCPIL